MDCSLSVGWSTASQQCLQNLDVIEEILEHLSPSSPLADSDLAERRSALLSAALTCRAFSPSALKTLWRRLDNLVPLLCLIRAFRAKLAPDEGGWQWGIYDVISPNDWDSFDRYGGFVKEIAYKPDPARDIDPSVHVHLACRSVPLLPNLVRFQCGNVRPPASEAILYMRPSLEILELLDTPSAAMSLALPALFTREARPRKLILHGQFVAKVIDRLPLRHLTSLEIHSTHGDLSLPLLHNLGRLPHLQSLSINSGCFSADFVPELPEDPATPFFPELRSAQLLWERSGPGHKNANSWPLFMLKTMDSQKVQSLVLRWMLGSAVPHWVPPSAKAADPASPSSSKSHLVNDGHIAAIARRFLGTLQELNFSAITVWPGDLQPLGRLSALRRLTLSGTYLSALQSPFDSHFGGLTELRFLSVRLSHPFTWRSLAQGRTDSPDMFLISIPTLAMIAKRCPNLCEAKAALSTADLPEPPKTPPDFTHRLRKLVVHSTDSPSDTITVARHWDHVFPQLRYVRFDVSDEDKYPASRVAWAEVEKLVLAFQEVRETTEATMRQQR